MEFETIFSISVHVCNSIQLYIFPELLGAITDVYNTCEQVFFCTFSIDVT